MTFRLRINGTSLDITSDPETPLVYVLRDELKMKGTKLGCGLEQCGACAVLVDGEVQLSCASPAETFADREITTIEAIGDSEIGARVQAAFVEASAAQCGYCTSGLVVAVSALLQSDTEPDRETVKEKLSPHLCRCGSHPRVLKAVELASSKT
jgi:aerobic-type carbon monoxide dehydrogenase small subunit (CoxS/CutS family)